MRDFRKLIAWQKAHALAVDVYRTIESTRGRSTAASRSQLQRAITSVPANIAEGCGKRSDVEFAHYIDIALGSAKEAESHLLFARDIGWLDQATYESLDSRLAEVRRILFGLDRALRARASMGTKGTPQPEGRERE